MSYWTKRRKTLATVQEIEQEILNEYKIQTENNPESTAQVNASQNFENRDELPSCNIVSSLATDHDNPCWLDSDSESLSDSGSISDTDQPNAESDSSSNDSVNQLQKKLQTWAASFCIPLIALTALLAILRSEFPDLPKDARTLLGTQTKVPVTKICNGEYYHFGLVSCLLKTLDHIASLPKITTLALQFNIDGIPLFKSSKTQFWPILGTIDCDKTRSPFIIGLFCGNSKPSSVWEYLRDFIAELRIVLREGIVRNGTRFKVVVSSFICDAPARAFVKHVKSHNGYYGCDKCSQTGVWSNKMTYPETDAPLRTDDDFEKMKNEEHHLGNSLGPLTGVVKMITQFPIDYMHTCCLGVTRRLIQMWMKGKQLRTRLSSQQIQKISDRLVALRPFMPKEFARKPRSLRDVDRWKATEFRQFMI